MSENINWPALNWFTHALIHNIGRNEWIRMTKEELAESKKRTGSDYPFKVISHPIPNGRKIVLKDGNTVAIKCDSQRTRQLLVDMAKAYDMMERKYHHAMDEQQASEWHPVQDLPPHSKGAAFHERSRIYYVYSPILHYVGGPFLGFRNEGKWYLKIGDKEIKHDVTHYRHLPPYPDEAPPYEEVKEDAEFLNAKLHQ